MTENYPLIGLTGHKGAGKDTVAQILKRIAGYQRQAWADALKLETYHAFGKAFLEGEWINGDYETDPDLLIEVEEYATFSRWLSFIDAHKHDAPESKYGWIRPMLQFWGTEYRRQLCGEDYWTKQLTLGPQVVVTDCRFPNEVAAILSHGGIIWKIERSGFTGDNHASEAHIDTLWSDVTILNSGTLEELDVTVTNALKVTQCFEKGGGFHAAFTENTP